MADIKYNSMELMICCAARLLQDGSTVAVGTGVPCAAAMLAQRTTAPNLGIVFEAGGVAPQLPTMPISVGDSRTIYRALMATSMADIMETCQRGLIDYTFLGGAQIDAYGNLNSTLIGGTYPKPKVRLPGTGAREAAGLPPGTGPYRVITDLAVMGYHEETKRMQVLSLHPGVTLERVRASTGFALGAVADVALTAAPSEEELRILREEVDPRRYLLGR